MIGPLNAPIPHGRSGIQQSAYQIGYQLARQGGVTERGEEGMAKFSVEFTQSKTVSFIFEAEKADEARRLADEVFDGSLYFEDIEPALDDADYDFASGDPKQVADNTPEDYDAEYIAKHNL